MAGEDLVLASRSPSPVLPVVARAATCGALLLVHGALQHPDAPPPSGLRMAGRPLPHPVCVGRFGAGRSAAILLAARLPRESEPAGPVELLGGSAPIGVATAPGHGTALELFADLPAADLPRLLRFLAGACATTLRAEADLALLALIRQLAGRLPRRATPLQPVVDLADGSVVLGGLPAGTQGAGAWLLVTDRSIRRLTEVAPPTLVVPRDGLTGIVLPPDEPGPLDIAAAEHLVALPSLLAGRPDGGAARRDLLPHLARLAAASPRRAALLRDVQLLAPQPGRVADQADLPVAGGLDLSLHDGEGVFLRGWLRDPLAIVEELRLHAPDGVRVLRPSELVRFAMKDAAPGGGDGAAKPMGRRSGFAAYVADLPGPQLLQWRLELRLGSGARLEVVSAQRALPPAAARDAVLRALPPALLTPAVIDGCLAPAAARFHAQALATRGASERVVIGNPVRAPEAAVIVPLYRNMHFLRFQLAQLARDAALRRTELIYVLDSPEQRAEVEHHLRGLAAVHDRPLTLVVQDANRGYASACNAGAAAATAPVLAMLNSDVLPEAPYWLRRLLTTLARHPGCVAVGPQLLFEDRSIQHAGLLFERGPVRRSASGATPSRRPAASAPTTSSATTRTPISVCACAPPGGRSATCPPRDSSTSNAAPSASIRAMRSPPRQPTTGASSIAAGTPPLRR